MLFDYSDTVIHTSSVRDILVIEDNAKILKHMSLILQENGYSVQPTNSLDNEIIRILAKQDFHAVLLDIPIPKQKGLEMLNSLEKADVLKKQKIILFTGFDLEQSQIEELKKKGFYLVLKKPVHPDKILKHLHSCRR